MKKIDKKIIKSILNENYFIGNYLEIVLYHKSFIIVYSSYMVRLHFGSYGWACAFYGEILHGQASKFLQLCDTLEENKYYLEGEE